MFLSPSLKKIVVFAVVYLVSMPLLFCVASDAGCQSGQQGWLGCSCMSVFNTIALYPLQYARLVTTGLASFSGYFALLWLGVAISYLLACAIVSLWWSSESG